MPYKVQRVFLSEKVPEAGKYTKTVSDNRAKYNTRHSEVFGQYDRTDNVSADLKTVTDIIAQFISVTVYHLFKVENNNG
jgi:hypothetical protein